MSVCQNKKNMIRWEIVMYVPAFYKLLDIPQLTDNFMSSTLKVHQTSIQLWTAECPCCTIHQKLSTLLIIGQFQKYPTKSGSVVRN